MKSELRVLEKSEIDNVSGGFVCGGLCVLGGIVGGIGLFTAGVSVGGTFYDALR